MSTLNNISRIVVVASFSAEAFLKREKMIMQTRCNNGEVYYPSVQSPSTRAARHELLLIFLLLLSPW